SGQLTAAQNNLKAKSDGSSEAEKKLASLQQQRDNLTKQKGELEAQLAAKNAAPAPAATEPAKLKQLEQERADLLRKLSEANKELFEAKNQKSADQSEFLKRQIGSLQARVDILEARKTPYTSEELALFKAPPVAV